MQGTPTMAVGSKFEMAPSLGTMSRKRSRVFSARAQARSTMSVAWASASKSDPTAVPFSMISRQAPKTFFSQPSMTSLARVYSGSEVSTT